MFETNCIRCECKLHVPTKEPGYICEECLTPEEFDATEWD